LAWNIASWANAILYQLHITALGGLALVLASLASRSLAYPSRL